MQSDLANEAFIVPDWHAGEGDSSGQKCDSAAQGRVIRLAVATYTQLEESPGIGSYSQRCHAA